MGDPSDAAIKVSLDHLDTAWKEWENAAIHLGNATQRIDSVRMSEAEAGLFIIAYNKYKDLPQYAFDRLNEGVTATTSISSTLSWGAATYKEEEAAGVHAFKHLY